MAEALVGENIPGYFGGLVLRAEGIDPDVSGYYDFRLSEKETNVALPLVRDINNIGVNADGTLVGNSNGDTWVFSAQDDKWNYDGQYAPPIKGVWLRWSYNSFPNFFMDLLDRLDGVYDGSLQPGTNYGLSFAGHLQGG